jgi:hypothetical protein
VLRPQVALDPAGKALAVWEQADALAIYGNRYADGWQEEVEVSDQSWLLQGPRHLAVEDNGSAWVAAVRINDLSVHVNRYVEGGGWQSVSAIPSIQPHYFAQSPQIGVDDHGNALAVWQQSDDRHYRIWFSRHAPSGAIWSSPTTIDNSDAEAAINPQLVVHADGHAMAVWWQDDFDENASVWAAHYVPGNGWGAPIKIEAVADAYFTGLMLGMDGQGNAIVAWQKLDYTNSLGSLWATRYIAASKTWQSGAVRIDEAPRTMLSIIEPRMAVDQAGNAVVVWQQTDENFQSDIFASHLTAGSAAWATPVRVSVDDPDGSGDNNAKATSVAMSDGTAWVVWQQTHGRHDYIWASRYSVGGDGWSAAKRIENSAAGDAVDPHIAMNANGDAVVVWGQEVNGTNTSSVWASRLKP